MLPRPRPSWKTSSRLARRSQSTSKGPTKHEPSKNLGKELNSALNLARKMSNSDRHLYDLELDDEKLNDLSPRKAINSRHSGSQSSTCYAEDIDKLVDARTVPSSIRDRNESLLKAIDKILKTKRASKITKSNICAFHLSPNSVNFNGISAKHEPAKPPRLAHKLERVLFQPMNFHSLQDSRTGAYNFNPWLEDIIKVENFDFNAIADFVSPSRDEVLLDLAEQHQKRYYSSTSSMTGILSHLHFLFSNFRRANLSLISKNFPQHSAELTRGAQLPGIVMMKRMRKKKPVFSIESDKSTDREIILSVLGHALETILTTEADRFQKIYDKSSNSHKPTSDSIVDSYHYSKISDFILRSQLDAYNPKLPGTGVFDLKTRAVAAIRHDIAYVEKNDNYTGYEIQKTFGKFESFEREFFELIRSTLLKYSLQARIGRMDGIFVAYHNISKMFGFQYLPLEEIDFILHSHCDSKFQKLLEERKLHFSAIYGDESYIMNHDRSIYERQISSEVADAEFKMSMSLLDQIFKQVENELPDNFDAARLIFKTEHKKSFNRDGSHTKVAVLHVIAVPISKEKLDFFQNNDLRDISSKGEGALSDYISEIREKSLDSSQKIWGFEVTLDHKINHNVQSIVVPTFASKKSTILDEQTKEFVNTTIRRNYYENMNEWKHVQFFHPLDVMRWKVDVQIHQIHNKEKLARLYTKYLDEKLAALQGQCLANDELPDNEQTISERIHNLMSGGEKSIVGKENNPEQALTVSPLQATLRAYSKKGDLRKNFSKHMQG